MWGPSNPKIITNTAPDSTFFRCFHERLQAALGHGLDRKTREMGLIYANHTSVGVSCLCSFRWTFCFVSTQLKKRTILFGPKKSWKRNPKNMTRKKIPQNRCHSRSMSETSPPIRGRPTIRSSNSSPNDSQPLQVRRLNNITEVTLLVPHQTE